jgi:hypothetical protein
MQELSGKVAVVTGGVLILGDAMYRPAQLNEMDLTAMHDVDPVLARRSRELLVREMESHQERTQVVGCHFPGLRAAWVVGGEVVGSGPGVRD